MKKIIIGTRGSKLSLMQTDIVKRQLEQLLPDTLIAIKTITTKGDKNMSPVPLDSVGKGWFTKEIDKELLAGTIDLAVHSLKDVPEVLPEGLVIAAIPKREDAREALVTPTNHTFDQLPKGAVIGTDSTRRKAQILHKRPDLLVESVRGNVITRLEKLDSGKYNGLFLAVAGLKRLGLADRISEYFPVTDMIPSPGQGALAVVIKKTNKRLASLLKKLDDSETVIAVNAERVFSKAVGGGCKMPVGAYAECHGKTIMMHGMIGSLDGKQLEKCFVQGQRREANSLAKKLAQILLKSSKPWYQTNDEVTSRYVVITRPSEDNELKKQIKALGLPTFEYPTIAITKNSLSDESKQHLQNLATFDWILFTSQHGVQFFMEALKELAVEPAVLKKKHIGVVGPKTKEALENFGFEAQFIPSEFTTEELAKQIKQINNKKILLPRSDIATPRLTELLEQRGAQVVTMPIYQTMFMSKKNDAFLQLLKDNQVQLLTFTSPSTVRGFLQSLPESAQNRVFQLPVLSIGPVTTAAAKKQGFRHITTANVHTTEGMLTVLQEIIL